ncbi:MAG: MBL fold metallo-hydrolase [Desulfobacterales bacterium]
MQEKNNSHPDEVRFFDKATTVTILGSGTCVPSLARSSSAALLEVSGLKLLIDIGPGTIFRLLTAGATIFDISHVFISHFHPDHTGELASFLFSYKHTRTVFQKKGVTIVGGKGLSDFYDRLRSVYGRWIEPEADGWPLKCVEMSVSEPDRIDFVSFLVDTVPVSHNPESIAFRITDAGGKSMVYSGDTDFCDDLVSLAQNADLLICDASTPADRKMKGHMSPGLAGKTARLANVGKLVLTHFYPECDRLTAEKECRTAYSGPLVLAEDLMILRLEE